jgi:hypothetical protein
MADGMDWECSMHERGEERSAYKVLVGRYQGKRPPRQSWENNIEMKLKETGGEGLDWIHLAQSKDCRWTPVNTVKNLQVA